MSDVAAVETEEENTSLLNVTPEAAPTGDAVDETSVPHLVQEAEPAPVEAPPAAERPENVQEQFWNAEKGEIDVGKLSDAYNGLRTKMDQGKHKVPDSYDTSSVPALAGVDENDEMLAGFRDLAKDQNLSQGQFEELTKFYLESTGALEQEIGYRRDEELGKLGRNADTIIKSTDDWLQRFHSAQVLNDGELEAISAASNNAAFISALNKIRRSYNEPNIPSASAQVDVAPATLADAQAMMADPKYGHDPAYTRQVEKIIYEMHGEQLPA